MRSIILVFEDSVSTELLARIKESINPQMIRFDLAWQLFLGEKGINEQAELDLPAGNPRTQWLPLNLWVRQTLGGYTNLLGSEETYTMGVITRCSPATLEYVSRMLSLYSQSLGVIRIGKDAAEFGSIIGSIQTFFNNPTDAAISDEWQPPVVNLFESRTALLDKTSAFKADGHYTWLSGVLGSNRLFAQVYQLQPNSSGNRLHSHSDVDEMYVVLEGTGSVKTAQGVFPLRKGDVISKPAGSSLATKFCAGEHGITILDIECWPSTDQTDVVVYPEHQEVALRGRGLNHGAPLTSYFSGDEISKHYNIQYERDKNGKRQY